MKSNYQRFIMRFQPDREPALDELLEDPAAQLLMQRDGVDEAMVRDLLSVVSRNLAEHSDDELHA
jgi:hypothetical protein